MGSKMDSLAVREHFLSKNAEKTAILGARFSDHLTSESLAPTIFKIETFPACVSENLGHKLSDEP